MSSVLPKDMVTMSPGVKGSLKSNNMPPKKLAAMSRAEKPSTKPPTPPNASVDVRGTFMNVRWGLVRG